MSVENGTLIGHLEKRAAEYETRAVAAIQQHHLLLGAAAALREEVKLLRADAEKPEKAAK